MLDGWYNENQKKKRGKDLLGLGSHYVWENVITHVPYNIKSEQTFFEQDFSEFAAKIKIKRENGRKREFCSSSVVLINSLIEDLFEVHLS